MHDFSSEVAQDCVAGHHQRIAFTPAAKPETGVRVVLDCAKPASGD